MKNLDLFKENQNLTKEGEKIAKDFISTN